MHCATMNGEPIAESLVYIIIALPWWRRNSALLTEHWRLMNVTTMLPPILLLSRATTALGQPQQAHNSLPRPEGTGGLGRFVVFKPPNEHELD